MFTALNLIRGEKKRKPYYPRSTSGLSAMKSPLMFVSLNVKKKKEAKLQTWTEKDVFDCGARTDG